MDYKSELNLGTRQFRGDRLDMTD